MQFLSISALRVNVMMEDLVQLLQSVEISGISGKAELPSLCKWVRISIQLLNDCVLVTSKEEKLLVAIKAYN